MNENIAWPLSKYLIAHMGIWYLDVTYGHYLLIQERYVVYHWWGL